MTGYLSGWLILHWEQVFTAYLALGLAGVGAVTVAAVLLVVDWVRGKWARSEALLAGAPLFDDDTLSDLLDTCDLAGVGR